MSTTRYLGRASSRPRLPPITECELCGRSLLCTDRYHVKLMLKSGPLAGTTVKVLHVCRECLERLGADRGLAKKVKVRYYRMGMLCPRSLL